jgi:hypothetical protein
MALVAVVYSMSEFSINWTVPSTLVGDWTGKQKVRVRFKNGLMKYSFLPASDSINLSITFKEDGSVAGSLGNATFTGCSVSKNRGWIGRKLHLFSDFGITGSLKGAIFTGDTLVDKLIMLPINLSDNKISGTIFQKDGADIYPMSDILIIKQESNSINDHQ